MLLVPAMLLTGGLAACSGDVTSTQAPLPSPSAPAGGTTGPSATEEPRDDLAALDPGDAAALSTPQADPVYPAYGDPSVDALHYDLDLTWDADERTLTGIETVLLRVTSDADVVDHGRVRLDLAPTMAVTGAAVDDVEVEVEHRGDDLLVPLPAGTAPDDLVTVTLAYTGTPTPVDAPTTRSDLPSLGLTVDPEGQLWTMQEPYGAHTWYAVNDHPSDKARYTFTLQVDDPWTGIANGVQTSSSVADGVRTTTYDAADPMASYLVTLAFGDYTETVVDGPRDLPISLWVPAGAEQYVDDLERTGAALTWVEGWLGPYPFDSAGVLLVEDSTSGMETQTLLTLGATAYSTSPATLVHEMVHQWWGDLVTPADWRGLWMNEGMAMYLQLVWEAEDDGRPLDDLLGDYVLTEQRLRAEAGPPASYDPDQFGVSNVYLGPALMWHAIRQEVGDAAFRDAVRAWPTEQAGRSVGRDELVSWWSERTGTELASLFDAWLDGEQSPAIDLD